MIVIKKMITQRYEDNDDDDAPTWLHGAKYQATVKQEDKVHAAETHVLR